MQVVSNLVEAHVIKIEGDDIKFLLLKRHENESYPNIWQMVTGSIEENEKAYSAAIREIKEETGAEINKLWIVPNVNSFYSSEKNRIEMVPVFAAETNCNNIKLSDEHSEYKWVNKDEAITLLAWPGQRRSVEIIHEYINGQNKFLSFIEINLSKI